MGEVGVKRKLIGMRDGGGPLMIYLLFGSTRSPKPVALFELKLRKKSGKGGERDGEGISAENEELSLIDTFYDQSKEKLPMGYVACVPLGGGTYFMMPNEVHRAISPKSEIKFDPFIFYTKTMETNWTPIPPPLCPKETPLAAAVGNKVYVLCRRTNETNHYVPPESSFEVYDPDNNSWKSLKTPWFNICNSRVVRHYPVGFAVVGECILVCLENSEPLPQYFPFYSYNTISKRWRFVRGTPFVAEDVVSRFNQQNKRIWYGEAVLKDGFIYGYVLPCHGLASFSCTMPSTKEDPFITIGPPVFLSYFEESLPLEFRSCEQLSYAVALIEDDLLCVVHTAPIGSHFQPVRMSLLRITEPGICNEITVLDLFMPRHDKFHSADITSCLVVQAEVDTSMDNEERGAKKPATGQ